MAEDAGCAFPLHGIDGVISYGMSLRDWFAGQALMAMGPEAISVLTNSVGDYEPGKVDAICGRAARMSYRFADAMLMARATQTTG